ncbi:MAG: mandelate racemase [Maritimibacter sp.]|nr:mandelate racemase [Maritimibacter sp.]
MTVPVYAISGVELGQRPVDLALPFHFGDVTVTETAEAYLRVTVQGPNGPVTGLGAQLMVPRWFDKRPIRSAAETVDDLRATLRATRAAAVGAAGTVRSLSLDIREAVRAALPADLPDLAAGFGPALLEMALIDAACRDAGVSFPDAVRADLFGVAEVLPPDLARADYDRWSAGVTSPSTLRIRHTVGFGAPLSTAEVKTRPQDGRPVALDEVIVATGGTAFKIKITGDVVADHAWLTRIAAVIGEIPGLLVTLDANEQYDPARLAALWAKIEADPALDRVRAALAYIEQPFAREIALSGDTRVDLPVPVIIDESDDGEDALPRAFARGYAGTSVKSCKGVLRALVNAARVAARGSGALLSAEDLTCQPGLCWQQDSLMAATVGATHAERNGHHFAGGMQGAGAAEQAAYLAAHPDIYTPGPTGPRLNITAGTVGIGSLDAPGFASTPGHDFARLDGI